jgi:hypothetical protein
MCSYAVRYISVESFMFYIVAQAITRLVLQYMP